MTDWIEFSLALAIGITIGMIIVRKFPQRFSLKVKNQ